MSIAQNLCVLIFVLLPCCTVFSGASYVVFLMHVMCMSTTAVSQGMSTTAVSQGSVYKLCGDITINDRKSVWESYS